MSGGTNCDADTAGRGWQWDVALSFAGAQRPYVEQVAKALKARGVRCFLDADEQIDLWGKYLAEELPAIYGERAATVVVFVSADYADRDWTRLERRTALNRSVRERRAYVLPARFDNTPLPGLLSDMVAVNLQHRKPEQFAAMIVDKLVTLNITPSAPPTHEGNRAPTIELSRQDRPSGRSQRDKPPATYAGSQRNYIVYDLFAENVLTVTRAVRSLTVTKPDIEAILARGRGKHKLLDGAARYVVAALPQSSAELILAEIRQTPTSGPSWHQGWCADLASPALRPHAAAELGDVVSRSYDPERLRHAITALGRMGAADWAPTVMDTTTRDEDNFHKLASTTYEALGRMFRDGSEYERGLAADALATMARNDPDPSRLHRSAGQVFRRMSPAHERTLRHWLTSDNEGLVTVAAEAFGYMQLGRMRQALLTRASGRPEVSASTASTLLRAIGMIGGPESARLLLARRLPTGTNPLGLDAALARCLHATEDDEMFASEVARLFTNNDPGVRALACRSLGLRRYYDATTGLRRASSVLVRALDDEEPVVRGAAALTLARLDLLDKVALERLRSQAAEVTELLRTTLATLLTTRDPAMVYELSELLTDANEFDEDVTEDVTEVLRAAGDDIGRELADALDWLRVRY